MTRRIARNQHSLTLGGEKIWGTALFADIAVFTAISENMAPEAASEMLNAYFSQVISVVFRHGGTLLKFIGDGVFVIWGAPLPCLNHAEQAVRAAIEIQVEVHKFNATKRFPPLRTRIGINTGSMLVGNLGTKERFDYTAIGDTINLASRIEAANKRFGTDILITGFTAKEIPPSIPRKSLGTNVVAGREQAVELFHILVPS